MKAYNYILQNRAVEPSLSTLDRISGSAPCVPAALGSLVLVPGTPCPVLNFNVSISASSTGLERGGTTSHSLLYFGHPAHLWHTVGTREMCDEVMLYMYFTNAS